MTEITGTPEYAGLTFAIRLALRGAPDYQYSARRLIRPATATLRYRRNSDGKTVWDGGLLSGHIVTTAGKVRSGDVEMHSGAPEWLHPLIRHWWPNDLYMSPMASLEAAQPRAGATAGDG